MTSLAFFCHTSSGGSDNPKATVTENYYSRICRQVEDFMTSGIGKRRREGEGRNPVDLFASFKHDAWYNTILFNLDVKFCFS
jgi:hypothetical protein